MRILVLGGSAAGLFTSLLLARAGHDVVVLERDDISPAPDVETAAVRAFRAAAPQIVQPHIVLALCRVLLRRHLPDVYEALVEAGAREAGLETQMAPTLADRSSRQGDERFTSLMTRRSTLDQVLRLTAAEQAGLQIRSGVRVLGLAGVSGAVPRVTGAHTGVGDFSADLVIDATGRRSQIDRWVTDLGGRASATVWAECGVAYYTRHYRLTTSDGLPGPRTTRIVAGLDEFTVGIWAGDNDTMVLGLAPLAEDKRFRRLADPVAFTALLRTVPVYAGWLEVLEPISGVYPMAGLHNTYRELVDDDGPIAVGLWGIGDVICTTNPTLGRGLSLALGGAANLLAALDEYDGEALVRILHERNGEDIAPYYADQALIDATRLAMVRHNVFGSPAPPPPPDDRVTYGQLRNAAAFDPTAFRAFWKVMGMITRPDEVYTDPEVIRCTREVLVRHGAAPPIAQPSHADIETALGG